MSVRTVLQRTEPALVWLDVVHPTAAGYAQLAAYIFGALDRAGYLE